MRRLAEKKVAVDMPGGAFASNTTTCLFPSAAIQVLFKPFRSWEGSGFPVYYLKTYGKSKIGTGNLSIKIGIALIYADRNNFIPPVDVNEREWRERNVC